MAFVGLENDVGLGIAEGVFEGGILFFDEVFGEDFNQVPACLVNDLMVTEEYIYEVHIVKMLLNQFGATFLGLMLSLATSRGQGEPNWFLVLAGSTLAILLYMFLQYNIMWDLGARDIIRVQANRAKYKPLTGLMMTAIANIPNAIIAVGVVIGSLFGSTYGLTQYEWAGSIGTVCRAIGAFWEGMFNGYVMKFSPQNPIIWVLMLIPPILAGSAGYIAGLKGFAPISILGIKNKNKNNDKK